MASELIGEISQFLAGMSNHNADVRNYQIVYHAPYNDIVDTVAKGDTITLPIGGTAYVLDAQTTLEEDGVMGTLTINATLSDPSASSGIEPTFEQIDIDFVETTEPIEFHPDFLDLVQASAEDATMKAWLKFKASPLSVRLENLRKVVRACKERGVPIRVGVNSGSLEKKYLDDPDDPDSTLQNLPNTITDWADLYNRGIETYITHLPVVTRIRMYDAQPMGLGEDLDTKESPPSSGCTPPDGYGEWLKTCDKASYTSTTGKWQRTEQWTCAAEWPDLLYGGSSS